MTVPAGRPLIAAIRPVRPTVFGRRPGKTDVSPQEGYADDRLWRYYEQIGEIHYWLQTQQSIAQALNYYPAFDTDDTDNDLPEHDEDPKVLELWNSLGGERLLRELVGELTVHLKVTGRAYLVALDGNGRPIQSVAEDEDTPAGTTSEAVSWDVMSATEFRQSTGGIDDADQYVAWKIWARHPRNGKEADSPLAVLDKQCETLLTLDSRMLADSRSRLFAGLVLLPDAVKNMHTDTGQTWDDMLEEAMLEPIRDADSVASVVPIFGYVPAELLGKAQQLTFGREDIPLASAQREELIRRIAAGLDAPAEYLLGMGDLNHWTSALVSDDAFDRHIGPTVQAILRDLTTWWQAMLATEGVDNIESRTLAVDPKPALRRQDQLGDTIQVFDRFGTDFESLRRAAGLDDEDAPTDEEIETRLRMRAATTQRRPNPDGLADPLPDSPNPADGDEPPAPPVAAAAMPTGRPAVIVAATDERADSLAADLTRLDRGLLAELEAETERQIAAAIEVARQRIIDEATSTGIAADAGDLFTRLTEEQIIDLAGTEAGVDPDLFDAATIAAIIAAYELIRQNTLDSSDIVTAPTQPMPDTALNAATTAIVAALVAQAVRAVLRNGPDPDRPRETTGRITEPPVWDLRRALTVAGGATLTEADLTPDVDMLGNGQRSIDQLAASGLVTVGYRWVYGDLPRKTFKPHARLDGQFFNDFDDPVLIPPPEASWIGSRLFGGDHKGCRCTFRRVIDLNPETPTA